MSDQPLGPGWWQASDGKYYPPETSPDWSQVRPDAEPPPVPPGGGGGDLPTSGGPAGPWTATGPPAFPHGPYAYGPVPPRQGTNGLAVAALVCSLLGLCTCLTAVAGVVLGHVALSQLARPGNHEGGRGLAVAGLAVGYGALGLWALWFVVSLAAS